MPPEGIPEAKNRSFRSVSERFRQPKRLMFVIILGFVWSGTNLFKKRPFQCVDLAEIYILVPTLLPKPYKSFRKFTRLCANDFSNLGLIFSAMYGVIQVWDPHQNIDLGLKSTIPVSIPQNLGSRTEKYRKFHLDPIFPGSLTRP